MALRVLATKPVTSETIPAPPRMAHRPAESAALMPKRPRAATQKTLSAKIWPIRATKPILAERKAPRKPQNLAAKSASRKSLAQALKKAPPLKPPPQISLKLSLPKKPARRSVQLPAPRRAPNLPLKLAPRSSSS
ncbi:hypothetical protein HYQ46_012374 [Verticillium longisporum]|nr:hypothetical protein HYQ46_012374 [Verticillium longisporum]